MYFKKVYGLDISPKNVEYTINELQREGYNNIECHIADIMNKEEAFKNKFDVISFVHGLEHFSDDDYPVLFENIKYYLKKDGVFTGALPNDQNFTYRMCPNCNNVFEIDGHISTHNKESLEKLFLVNNFKILYLNDFNIYHYKKYKGFNRFIYRMFLSKVLKRNISGSQLEYIVKPY